MNTQPEAPATTTAPDRPGQVVTHRTNGGVGITTDSGVNQRTGSIGVHWAFSAYAVRERPENLEVIAPDAVRALITRADDAYECPDCGEGHDGMTTGTEYCPGCTEG